MAFMPRLSPQLWQQRRQHVLESAWACFARSGFDATSMDDIIAQTGWSVSAVYHYVDGKDELVAAAGAEAFEQLRTLTQDLVAREPAPTPREVVKAFVELLDDKRHHRRYSLAGLVIHTWAAGLHEPAVAARGRTGWNQIRADFAVLARRWQNAGTLPEGISAADVAACLAMIAPSVIVDGAFLDGRGSSGLLRLLRAVELNRPAVDQDA